MLPTGFQGMAGDRMIRQEDLVAGTSALQLSASLRAVSKSAQRLSNAYQADYAALPGCSDTCMEGLVEVTNHKTFICTHNLC